MDTDRLYVCIFVGLELISTRYFCSITAQPNAFIYVFVRQLIEDSIAAQDDEIMVLCDVENLNFRLCFYDTRIAASILKLGFRIAEGSADGKSSR